VCEVGPPRGVIGIGIRFHFEMPLVAAARSREQSRGDGCTVPAANYAAEDPVPGADCVEVALAYPTGSLLGMTAACPRPECLENSVVHSRKGTRTGHMAMEERPAPNNGVESFNQVASRDLTALADNGAHLVQERLRHGSN
jgi:hypothetical protein